MVKKIRVSTFLLILKKTLRPDIFYCSLRCFPARFYSKEEKKICPTKREEKKVRKWRLVRGVSKIGSDHGLWLYSAVVQYHTNYLQLCTNFVKGWGVGGGGSERKKD